MLSECITRFVRPQHPTTPPAASRPVPPLGGGLLREETYHIFYHKIAEKAIFRAGQWTGRRRRGILKAIRKILMVYSHKIPATAHRGDFALYRLEYVADTIFARQRKR